MPDQLQLRGGTTAEHSTFTGAIKEVTVDTSKKTVVVHDGTTAGGIALLRQDGSNSALALGSEGTPSLKWDANTGIFSPGDDQLAIVTGANRAITCTSTQAVGIKTSNPNATLHVAGSTRVGADSAADAILEIGEGATGNRNSYIDIVADTTYTDYGLRVIRNNTGANATSELKHRGTGALNITTQEAAPIVFNTTNSPRLTILAGGNVGIGTSSPTNSLTIVSSINFPFIHWNNSSNTNIAFAGWHGGSGGGDDFRLGTESTKPIAFHTNNTEKVRIRSDGMFEVKGAGTAGSSPAFSVNGSAPANSAIIDTSGRLLVGTVTGNANGGILQLSGGITFPATAVAASDANTLDDYEEGTWTPTQGAGLTVVGTFTSAGHYTKVGRQVTVQGFVRGSTSVASAGGSVFCSGLPFAVQNVNDTNFIGSGSDGNLTGLINIWIDRNQAGVYSVTSSAVTASIYFTGSYFTP